MVEAMAQAKQLDSVTDFVQEQEVDATRALEAMSAFATTKTTGTGTTTAVAQAQSSNSNNNTNTNNININTNTNTALYDEGDAQLICNELFVTQELAKKTLREVASSTVLPSTTTTSTTSPNGSSDCKLDDKNALVVAALKQLILS